MKQPIPLLWSSWIQHRRLYQVLISLILSGIQICPVFALSPTTRFVSGQITLQDETLTARIINAPLYQVLEEISRLSGARIRWLGQGGEEPVSVHFTGLPFAEGMKRILGEKNFLLFFTPAEEGTRLTQIWISSQKPGRPQLGLSPHPFPEGNITPPPPPTDPIHPYNEETPDTLIETALHDPNLVERIAAITQLREYAQEDPRVKTILSQVAQTDSDPQVQEAAAELLRGME